MLRIKINKKYSNQKYSQLNVINVEDIDNGKLKITSESHGLRSNDTIRISRCENGIFYYDEQFCDVLDDDTFIIDNYEDVILTVSSVTRSNFNSTKNYPIPYLNKPYLLTVTLSEPHTFVLDKEKPKEQIYELYDEGSNSFIPQGNPYLNRRCYGDHALYKGLSFEMKVGDDNRYYPNFVSFGEHETGCTTNNLKTTIYYYDKYYNKVEITDLYVPLDETYTDDLYHLYYFTDSEELTDLELYFESGYTFYSRDDRFFTKDSDSNTIRHYSKGENTTINVYDDDGNVTGTTIIGGQIVYKTSFYKIGGEIDLSLPVGELFEGGLSKEDTFGETYVGTESQKELNQIIDYEKQMFTPVIKNEDGTFNEVGQINFNLHLRERDIDVLDDTTDSSVTEYVKNEEWSTDNDKYWFMFGLTGMSKTGWTDPSIADPIFVMGFTDDDIRYQHKKVSKSFIRLSFYDTPYRTNQALQFYSTIFLDSGKLYKDYIDLSNYLKTIETITWNDYLGPKGEETTELLSYGGNNDYRIPLQFSCASKYNMTACSEGFYLYLFSNLLNGDTESILYMKAELNNAKYGNTITLTMPTDTTGNILNGKNTSFPINYVKSEFEKNENGEYTEELVDLGTDIDKLYNDVYIKVGIQYDKTKKRYVWYFKNNIVTDSVNTLNINLYEPRVNGWGIETKLREQSNGNS